MPVRQTSIDCYNQIIKEGLITDQRLEVYEAIYQYAPCTSSEAMYYTNASNNNNVFSQARARFTELRDMGVIYERCIRKCRITGRNVTEWDLTDNLPVPNSNKAVTKTQKIKELKSMICELDNKVVDSDIKSELNNIINYMNVNFK